jgi:hypothetical protein
MLDIASLTTLASSAVMVLTPLLQKAAEKGAEELGKSSAGVLFTKLKQRLSHAGAKEALDDLAKQPGDTAAQGALNMQLRKALEADPDLAAFLTQWVAESESKTGISQTANVQGNNNKTTQIVGSGNSVS